MSDDLTVTYGVTAGQARAEQPPTSPTDSPADSPDMAWRDAAQPDAAHPAPGDRPEPPVDVEPADRALRAARRRQPGQQLAAGEG